MNKKDIYVWVVLIVIIMMVLLGVYFGKTKANVNKIKAGDYYLDYGLYQSDLPETAILGGTFELKKDGTFRYKNVWVDNDKNEHQEDEKGNYEVFYSKEDGNIWVIKFNFQTGENAGSFRAFRITANNKFSAEQYHNDFIYQN